MAKRARRDPAHSTGGMFQAGEPPAGEEPTPRELLEHQARELADYLRRWQSDLDRRERRLHEQWAALENERRRLRLWARELSS